MTILEPASIPADDRGFLLGDALFETIRLYGGVPFRLERHLERLRASAERVGMAVPESIEDRIGEALRGWSGGDGALRITLSRGASPGLLPPDAPGGRLHLLLRPLHPVGDGIADGVRTVVRGRIDERALTAGLKTTGYLERIQAARLAREAGAEEALISNSAGLLVEGTASNLIGVKGATLVAPGAHEGALPGITRDVLLEVAKGVGGGGTAEAGAGVARGEVAGDARGEVAGDAGTHPAGGATPAGPFTIEERGIAFDELDGFTELFLTSSLKEIVPIVEVEGVPIGSGRPGPVVAELGRRFRALVVRETGAR